MPLSDVDSQIMMLYEVASLSDELRDEGAKMLLQWAEKQVTWLAEREKSGGGSDEAFQEQCVTLHRLMKRAGRLVGRWHDLSPEEQQERLTQLVETGRELGYHVDETKVSAFKESGVPGEQTAVQALLEVFASEHTESTPSDTEAAQAGLFADLTATDTIPPDTEVAQAGLLADLSAMDGIDTQAGDTVDDESDAQSPELL